LAVTNAAGSPTIYRHLLWSFTPLFGKEDALFKGLAIRNSLNGKYIRGNPGMPDGGGVSLVEEKDVDEWAGWGIGTNPGGTSSAAYVPFILNPAPGICVMTLYGASDWKPGTQVITYRWSSGLSQLWLPGFNPTV